MALPIPTHLYSLIVAIHSTEIESEAENTPTPLMSEVEGDWRLGEINVDWVDFTREKSIDKMDHTASNQQRPDGYKSKSIPSSSHKHIPGSSIKASSHTTSSITSTSTKKTKPSIETPDSLSLQPLLGHYPNPSPLDSSFTASGISELGKGVIHLFKHQPPKSLILHIDSHPFGGESSSSSSSTKLDSKSNKNSDIDNSTSIDKSDADLMGEDAEGKDGSLIAILAVPAWMKPSDFIEFIGGWSTCLEGIRMIREATTPNRSIVLLKFRDPLQASDFSTIFTGKAFSTLDPRETCHPIRIHHLILHKLDKNISTTNSTKIPIPAFPPSVYSSRTKELGSLLKGIDKKDSYELPSCPVCLERLDSTVTGLVTLPCAHTFDCDCLKKWGDSRCPVCRLSHLLLSSASTTTTSRRQRQRNGREENEITRLTKCSMCNLTENNWICVICGIVGCGRYEPGKAHARRHWEESGHVLAMELETQRVWDYKGDNYVHRLIQSRSDGKLVELPSASSLVTSHIHSNRILPLGGQDSRRNSTNNNNTPSPPNQNRVKNSTNNTNHGNGNVNSSSNRSSIISLNDSGSAGSAGPSTNDLEKISTIESITLEYSYLLSSQLESMRHHYESQQSNLIKKLEETENQNKQIKEKLIEKEKEKEKEIQREKDNKKYNENKALKAIELSRTLQNNLNQEKSLTNGLSNKIKILESQLNELSKNLKLKENECLDLEDTVKDLMFSLDASSKFNELGDENGQNGDLMIVPSTNTNQSKSKSKKKK
ncbi:uncharacterized protein L201_006951 [Kwoniella dendrophila CBS 6074]|uniref:BRCA1-associated protein n=1 Tax=Kwoniella dendrophila CBS 6074 TaxID=1295534 RepID=A0AAX4K332_9TREE